MEGILRKWNGMCCYVVCICIRSPPDDPLLLDQTGGHQWKNKSIHPHSFIWYFGREDHPIISVSDPGHHPRRASSFLLHFLLCCCFFFLFVDLEIEFLSKELVEYL